MLKLKLSIRYKFPVTLVLLSIDIEANFFKQVDFPIDFFFFFEYAQLKIIFQTKNPNIHQVN